MSNLKAISDALVHSIFVIKYLVLSMKVKEIVTCKPDKWLAVKSWTVIISQTLLIFAPWISSLVLNCYPNKVIFTDIGNTLISIAITLPPYTIVIILAFAFYNLKGNGGYDYSISKV